MGFLVTSKGFPAASLNAGSERLTGDSAEYALWRTMKQWWPVQGGMHVSGQIIGLCLLLKRCRAAVVATPATNAPLPIHALKRTRMHAYAYTRTQPHSLFWNDQTRLSPRPPCLIGPRACGGSKRLLCEMSKDKHETSIYPASIKPTSGCNASPPPSFPPHLSVFLPSFPLSCGYQAALRHPRCITQI